MNIRIVKKNTWFSCCTLRERENSHHSAFACVGERNDNLMSANVMKKVYI